MYLTRNLPNAMDALSRAAAAASGRVVATLLIGLTATLGCGDDSQKASRTTNDASQADADAGDTAPENRAPTAQAEAVDQVEVGQRVWLDATAASDPDNDVLTFTWEIVSAPDDASATISDVSAAHTSFTPDAAGPYELAVEVSDGPASDRAQVSFEAFATPTAEAGSDKSGNVGEAITLDASGSSAPGGATLRFEWKIVSAPQGSSASFDDPSAKTTTFTPDVAGVYVAEVQVSNGVATSTDRVTLQVTSQSDRLSSVVYVSQSGDDSASGTRQNPVASFDAALQIFRDESGVSRIQLGPGEYDIGDATKTISSDLDIEGPSDSQQTATLVGTSTLLEASSDAFITVLDITVETPGIALDVADDASLSLIGVTCRADTCVSSGTVFGPGDAGGDMEVRRSELIGHTDGSSAGVVAALPDDITIVKSTIRGFEQKGILVANGALTLRDSTIENNGRGVELLINQSEKATRIINTNFTGNQDALRSEDSENVTLRDSSIVSSTRYGVYANGGAVSIKNTSIESGGDHGLYALSNTVVTVRQTEVFGNGGNGIRVEGEGARVDLGDDTEAGNNEIYDNTHGQIHDARPASATSQVTLSATELSKTTSGLSEPPAGTYSGPGFSQYGIVIDNGTSVIVY